MSITSCAILVLDRPAAGISGGLRGLSDICPASQELPADQRLAAQQHYQGNSGYYQDNTNQSPSIEEGHRHSLTVRNEDEERARRMSQEARGESLPNCEESPKPTLEEVQSWSQSFDKLMKSPAGRNAFREFLRTEYSEENMLFWLACEELKNEVNKNLVEEKARLIYEDYISILSPKEVSLDSRVREVINRNMLEPTPHTFDDAQLQIYTLMHRDSYPRFMNSAVYKMLLQSLTDTSSEP
ncbi:regulator of G-protein signaling 20 isoform X3 [Scyliorhinus canicula]|uniref:regulator of G-protein signaling 20 isoform X3 n=1 Tax=Scyliorhinus canicula TaxID=7830 RepID=UPI0018F3200F|nr:regulator of G-protein signaling 20 isoform X3 [Scyliorhinus canicula]